jgi:hypothetical protein
VPHPFYPPSMATVGCLCVPLRFSQQRFADVNLTHYIAAKAVLEPRVTVVPGAYGSQGNALLCELMAAAFHAPHRIASHRIASHRIASHRIASHRIASHRIASHRIASLTPHTCTIG